MSKFELHVLDGKFHWKFVVDRGGVEEVLAISPTGFVTRAEAIAAIQTLRRRAARSRIVDPSGDGGLVMQVGHFAAVPGVASLTVSPPFFIEWDRPYSQKTTIVVAAASETHDSPLDSPPEPVKSAGPSSVRQRPPRASKQPRSRGAAPIS